MSRKLLKITILLFAFSATPGFAQETGQTGMLPELVLRPIGLLGSAFSTGLFLACAPISALATIPEPHDALGKTYHAFVVTPFRFTFQRPLGDYRLLIDSD